MEKLVSKRMLIGAIPGLAVTVKVFSSPSMGQITSPIFKNTQVNIAGTTNW